MREHASNDPGTYGRFLNDLETARKNLLSVRPPQGAIMHPDSGKALGFDPALVDDVMSGKVTDHPVLWRVEITEGKYALGVRAT